MAEAVEYPKVDGMYVGEKGQVWRKRNGVLMPMVPTPFSAIALDGPFRPLVVDESVLDGASPKLTPPQEMIANAAEFAAEWNLMTVAQRERWFDSITSNANWAHRCFIENHDGSLAVLQKRLRERDAASYLEVAEAVDRAMIRRDMELRAQYGDVHVRSLIVEVVNEVIGRG